MKRIGLIALCSILVLSACNIFKKSKNTSETLANTKWELMYINQYEAEQTNNPITINFEENSTYNGNGGCNGYSGEYSVNKHQLTLSPVMSTKIACAVGMKTEQHLFKLLNRVNQYKITEGQLTLMDDQGEALVHFVKAKNTQTTK